MKDIAIVYMAAGISSRFGGKIKQLAKITDSETLIEHSINQALKAGFTKIIFIVGNLTEKSFKEKFGTNFKEIPISYALQTFNPKTRDKPWGTADALCSIKNIIDCPFIVCNGDDIYGEDTFKILINHLLNHDNNATIGYKLVETLPETGKVNRAVFDVKDGHVISINEIFNIEKSNLSAFNLNQNSLTSMNIFALYPETIQHLNEFLEFFKNQKQEDRKAECLIQHAISEKIKENKISMKIYEAVEKPIGITSPEDVEVVRNLLKM